MFILDILICYFSIDDSVDSDTKSTILHNMDALLELEISSDGGDRVMPDIDESSAVGGFVGIQASEVECVSENVLSMINLPSVESIVVSRLMRQILIAASRTIAGNE